MGNQACFFRQRRPVLHISLRWSFRPVISNVNCEGIAIMRLKSQWLAAMLLGSLAGCAKPVPTEAPVTSITRPEDAIAAFVSQWESVVLPKVPDIQPEYLPGYLKKKLAARDKMHAHRSTYQASFQRVSGTLTERQRKQLILHGTLDDLKRGGECWTVGSYGGFMEIGGFLDAETGKLVFAWIIPEG